MAALPLPLPATPYAPKSHEAPRPASLHATLASLSQHGGDHGSLRDAFALVSRAERQSSPGVAVAVGPEVYASLLQCCVAAESLRTGRQVHAAAVKRGPYYCRHTYIGTKLAVFYARCGALADAERVFDALPKKNAFSWAAVIGLWSRAGLHARALAGYVDMLEAGVPADNFVVPNVLKACAGIGMLAAGRALHGYAWKAGFGECVYVLSSLVDFYGKCGEVDDARQVFDAMPETTVVTWNSMLMGYINNGRIDDADGARRRRAMRGLAKRGYGLALLWLAGGLEGSRRAEREPFPAWLTSSIVAAVRGLVGAAGAAVAPAGIGRGVGGERELRWV